MKIVKKSNRIVTVEPSDLDYYLDQGYDHVEFDEEVNEYKVIAKANGGKSFTLKEYNLVVDAFEDANKKIAELEETNKKLETEIKKLKK